MVARRFAGSKLDTIAAVKPARQSDALLTRKVTGAPHHVGRATWLPAPGRSGGVEGSPDVAHVTRAALPMTCLVIAIIPGFLQR